MHFFIWLKILCLQTDIYEVCSSPAVLAQQLTHIEMERLSMIGPEEFVQAFAKDNEIEVSLFIIFISIIAVCVTNELWHGYIIRAIIFYYVVYIILIKSYNYIMEFYLWKWYNVWLTVWTFQYFITLCLSKNRIDEAGVFNLPNPVRWYWEM